MIRRPWRCGLIGCGFFAPNQMHAWRSIPDVEVAAICDRDLNKARAMSDTFGVKAVYDDAARMLGNEQLDFVDVVTTVESHRKLVELAASHGKAVICQKPLAPTLDDADAMVAACRHARTHLLVHENFRWQRPFLELAKRIARNDIGQPTSLRLTFRHAYDIYRTQPYLAKAERLALMDVGLHLFDLARALLGDVRSLRCDAWRLNPAVRGEDAFLASLEHRSGAVTVVDCSFFSTSDGELFPQTLATLEGSNGMLELAPNYQLKQRSTGGIWESDVSPEVPSWGAKPWHCVQDSVLNFQRHVVDVLEGRAEPQPSGAHNRDTLALVLAAYESAAMKRTILIDPTRAAS